MKTLTKRSTGEILTVTECYAYRYDYGAGKTVLRAKCSSSDADFAEIQMFFAQTDDYEYREDGSLMTVYTQYGADLDVHYKRPTPSMNADGTLTDEAAHYEIEVLRDPSVEAAMRNLAMENESLRREIENLRKAAAAAMEEITTAQIAIAEIYEAGIEARNAAEALPETMEGVTGNG